MRRVQISLQINRFSGNAPNGKSQTLKIYADANNEYEALCSAFYEALDALQATDGSLPSFGRRNSWDENFPSKSDGTGYDQHLSDTIKDMDLAPGDITTFHIAQSKATNYVVLADLYDGKDGRAKGGRVLGFANSKAEAADIALEQKVHSGLAILSSHRIPHDCRIFKEDATAELKEWVEKC